MRRATLLAQLARGAARGLGGGAPAEGQQQLGGATAAAARGMAGHGAPPAVVPNPLQQIVPPIIKGIKAGVDGIKNGIPAAAAAIVGSGAARSAVAYFADNVLLSGTFADARDLDLPKWAAWLAANGYENKEGWAKIVAAVRERLPSLTAADVSALAPALHSQGLYSKDVFEGFAAVIKSKFAEFETPALLPDIARTFAAYAKFGRDRADLFIPLARAVHEDRLRALEDPELRATVVGLLAAFSKLHFWPDCTEALFVIADQRPAAFQGADNAVIQEAIARMRAATGGSLPWYEGGFKDWEHFHGRPFGDYNLWVVRDELYGQTYRPSDISPAAKPKKLEE
ncbi:hypothetical protein Rsub_05329 [Raphidocelis subcapitata]|uniref:Uncharacterized protein n=1 Tax=Raphidocelis subcapitata TaxID=307507 RepID=A0A2V0NX88_9CHLO|nr:hypothetical protein Rsub_05329 [Raphidocelis subcapitata]|eukprot:GBF92246.1 hypothetical protein Rsub_05329 [Raphidocelis subcapitata]